MCSGLLTKDGESASEGQWWTRHLVDALAPQHSMIVLWLHLHFQHTTGATWHNVLLPASGQDFSILKKRKAMTQIDG